MRAYDADAKIGTRPPTSPPRSPLHAGESTKKRGSMQRLTLPGASPISSPDKRVQTGKTRFREEPSASGASRLEEGWAETELLRVSSLFPTKDLLPNISPRRAIAHMLHAHGSCKERSKHEVEEDNAVEKRMSGGQGPLLARAVSADSSLMSGDNPFASPNHSRELYTDSGYETAKDYHSAMDASRSRWGAVPEMPHIWEMPPPEQDDLALSLVGGGMSSVKGSNLLRNIPSINTEGMLEGAGGTDRGGAMMRSALLATPRTLRPNPDKNIEPPKAETQLSLMHEMQRLQARGCRLTRPSPGPFGLSRSEASQERSYLAVCGMGRTMGTPFSLVNGPGALTVTHKEVPDVGKGDKEKFDTHATCVMDAALLKLTLKMGLRGGGHNFPPKVPHGKLGGGVRKHLHPF